MKRDINPEDFKIDDLHFEHVEDKTCDINQQYFKIVDLNFVKYE